MIGTVVLVTLDMTALEGLIGSQTVYAAATASYDKQFPNRLIYRATFLHMFVTPHVGVLVPILQGSPRRTTGIMKPVSITGFPL